MSSRLGTFRDASGRITVAVFSDRSSSQEQHHHDVGAQVSEDLVVVGGGAAAQNRPQGALLTASYPNRELRSWLASSKDHIRREPHFLRVFAIGLSVAGMSRDALVDAIHVDRSTSGFGQHPEETATLPTGFVLLGGGFRVEWSGSGNLATASYPPNRHAWTARSKDHIQRSEASITSYVLGIRADLPVGRVESSIEDHDSAGAQHPRATADVRAGFALTGGGAEAHWRSQGGLLWQLQPTTDSSNQDFTASSKDHIRAEAHKITTYAVGIRLR